MASPAVLSGIAAGISALFAGVSWFYSKEKGRPSIILDETSVQGQVPNDDQWAVNVAFRLRNKGAETANIEELEVGRYLHSGPNFELIQEGTLLNDMGPESIFGYNDTVEGTNNTDLDQEQLIEALPHLLPQPGFLGGNPIFYFVRVEYSGDSLFSWGTEVASFFLGYNGQGDVFQMEPEHWEQIRTDIIPDRFHP